MRFAVSAMIVLAAFVVAGIIFSRRSAQPVAESVPKVVPALPTGPTRALLHIDSIPRGAEVMRLGDNRKLGTTPLADVRPADGRLVTYLFHLAGHVDVQMPIQVTHPGRFDMTATLIPIERRSESGGRPAASERHGGKGAMGDARPRP